MAGIDKIEKITIDGIDYFVNDLPPQLQHLVQVYERTYAELVTLEEKITVLNFARQAMGSELVASIQQLLDKQKETPTINER